MVFKDELKQLISIMQLNECPPDMGQIICDHNCDECWYKALFNLRSSDGLRLAIVKDNSDLPANIYSDNQYGIAQQDMLKYGYVREIKDG